MSEPSATPPANTQRVLALPTASAARLRRALALPSAAVASLEQWLMAFCSLYREIKMAEFSSHENHLRLNPLALVFSLG